MKVKYIFILLITIGLASCNQGESIDYTKYVNPFIGNADNGHTFPGACAPFGLIQASPQSGYGSWRYCSGFNYEDDSIIGFSQTHLNGTGVPDLGDIRIFPFNKSLINSDFASAYDKQTQKAYPGYYSVKLTDTDIDVELTATERTSFHKYTFNQNDNGSYILLDLQHGLGFTRKDVHHRVVESEIDFREDGTIVGYNKIRGWVSRYCYYAIKFDKAYTVKEKLPKNDEAEKAGRYILDFDNEEVLQIKIGISTVSIAGAEKALKEESPDWNFEELEKQTRNKWNNLLSTAKIEGSEDQKINFYTSMYHLFIQPNNIADVDGKYRGVNDSVYTSSSKAYYSTFSLWDTYRAAHPLYTILAPDRVNDFVNSMLEHQDKQGYLPIWTLWGKENYCMIGNHSVPVIVDAYLKGISGFDEEKAYSAIKKSLTVNHRGSDWTIYDKYGYYPFDSITKESVSRTLESAYDDYCAALVAQKLGKKDDYDFFLKRSGYYKNLFDNKTKMMRGKDSNGNWRTPFDSFSLSHEASHGGDYTEGNAWQYTWHVQHDIEQLVEMMGGKDSFSNKLDSLFFIEGPSPVNVLDVTGLIGQYAHGNEPSHHVVYLYNYVDKAYKTQELIREIFDRFYLPKPNGLCGNDDCGQMSAWYIFSSMGFYPVNPCGGEYIIGAPQIPQIELSLADGKTFTVKAQNISEENKYVKSVTLNNETITNFRISHKDIMNGGTLVFEMTNKLNK